MNKFSIISLLSVLLINGLHCSEGSCQKKSLDGIVFRLAKFDDLPMRMGKPINEFEYLAIIPAENALVGYCRVSLLPDKHIRLQYISVGDDYRKRGIKGELRRTAERDLNRSLEK